MTINSVEEATAYGALDSTDLDADTDEGFDTARLRALVMACHRLKNKAQFLFSMPWIIPINTETSPYGFQTRVSTQWQRIIAPQPILKRPWLNTMRADITLDIPDSVMLQFATSAAPFSPRATNTAPNTISIAGLTDPTDDVSLATIPLLPGSYESVEVYAKGRYSTAAGTTIDAYDDANVVDWGVIPQRLIVLTDGTASGVTQLLIAQGLQLEFTVGGNPFKSVTLTGLGDAGAGNDEFWEFTPHLTGPEVTTIMNAKAATTATWTLKSGAVINLVSLGFTALARSG